MHTRQMQEAMARLSEVVKGAERDGPPARPARGAGPAVILRQGRVAASANLVLIDGSEADGRQCPL